VPLLFFDLDNTLLDRAGAVRQWAQSFLAGLGVPEDLDWLIAMDADGLTSRWDLAEAIRDRYLLSTSLLDLMDTLSAELVDRARLDPMDACALRIAADAGWVPVLVSNGDERIQEDRITRSGLDRYVATWVVAGEAGVSKPNPRIFEIAAARAGTPLRGAWVIGDGPEEDIGGADVLGLPSVWLHRGREWSERRYAPTRVADCVIGAVAAVLDSAEPARAPGPARGRAAGPPPSRPAGPPPRPVVARVRARY
jgi:putative hydrolase of the HAD superfamily